MANAQQFDPITVSGQSYTGITQITLTSIGNQGESNFGGTGTTGAGDIVIFKNTPEVEEQSSTAYIIEDSIRSPASLIVWMGSPSRRFTINARLISRTVDEARENWGNKVLLQSWRMPTSGGIGNSSAPEVVVLDGHKSNFLSIPCIVQSVNISYPIDVDYIDIGVANVPIVWPISVSLVEYHTEDDMSNTYNYDAFRSGTLEGWN